MWEREVSLALVVDPQTPLRVLLNLRSDESLSSCIQQDIPLFALLSRFVDHSPLACYSEPVYQQSESIEDLKATPLLLLVLLLQAEPHCCPLPGLPLQHLH